MVCCFTMLLNSIRAFHDNQLGSTPWISLGAYNHHTPSAQTGTGETRPRLTRMLQCNVIGQLGAMKRQFVVYFKAFYSNLWSFLQQWMCTKYRFSPLTFCSSAPLSCILGVDQEDTEVFLSFFCLWLIPPAVNYIQMLKYWLEMHWSMYLEYKLSAFLSYLYSYRNIKKKEHTVWASSLKRV